MARSRMAVLVLVLGGVVGCGGKSDSMTMGNAGTAGAGGGDAASGSGGSGQSASPDAGPGTGGRGNGSGGTDVGGAGGTGPACRSATQACAVTTDCCSNLICVGNACVAPPQCRAATQACAVTTDCCNPLVCLQNVCQAVTGPSCGDRVCSAGEASTCCQDCGCPSGGACTTAGTCIATTTQMTWTFQDLCPFDGPIEIRLFDETNVGFWPPDPTTVYTIDYGETREVTLACLRNAEICFGASQPTVAGFWGVDIDNSQDCQACCALCNGLNPERVPLTCQ